MFGIVVDSSCDLRSLAPQDTALAAYSRVPLKLDIGETQYVDDETLDVDAFLEALYAYPGKTGSAAPSPQEWLSAYEKAEEVFAITITSALSGSYSSAMVAAEMFRDTRPDRKIFLFDSKSTGPEMILQVRFLADGIAAGKTFEQLKEQLQMYSARTHLLFALESMDNLVKNGRVSKIVGKLAGLLGIRIVGQASREGTLEVLHKCRGRLTACEKLLEEMQGKGYSGGRVIISHCQQLEKATYLKEQLQKKWPQCSVEILPTGGLCSYYAERGGLLVGYETP